ncbi:hypothetical protein L6452_22048 [Arctium lappa]|uniref:Uncharacterized protein n=1 Tax=Arctium lappa TaxID=4217 RepID=A0ACB9AZE2_ARCLA|nr:hypothetical protein L6452_22048 [Arctium lappa]
MRFDLRTEKFSEIAAPSFRNLSPWCLNFMVVVRGCIHFCVAYCITNENSRVPCRRRAIEIWRMDEDEDWRKVVTYFPISSFPWYQQPLHVMKNGNWLMHSKEKGYVYKADLEKNTKDRLCSCIGMDILPGGKYIETFVSLNQ